MSARLVVPRLIYDEMIEHCRAGLPNEACGFIAGQGTAIQRIYPLTNEAASPVYYRPSGKEMLDAIKDIDDSGFELAIIFHSHVASPPVPSDTDVREAHYPNAAYVIVSFERPDEPTVRAWKILKDDWRDETGSVEEVELVLS